MSLLNLQAEFAESIFFNYPVPQNVLYAEHAAIYRNNWLAALMKALTNTYPLICRLVGEDFFRVTAKEYIQHYPSRSGDLHEYGAYFSDFLAGYPPLKSLSYLAEVAKFEWACHALLTAPNPTEFDFSPLQQVMESQYDQLHFQLHPASLVTKFHYPILKIIELCKTESSAPLDINSGGIHLLMIRRGQDIVLKPLDLGSYICLHAMQENAAISEALQSTLQVDPQFRFDENLASWLREKIIVGFYLS